MLLGDDQPDDDEEQDTLKVCGMYNNVEEFCILP